MNDLELIVQQIKARKVMFDEGDLYNVLYENALAKMKEEGFTEPYDVGVVSEYVTNNAMKILNVADELYEIYDRPIKLTISDKNET